MPVRTPGSTTSGSWPRYCLRERHEHRGQGRHDAREGDALDPRGLEAGGGEEVADEDAVLVRRLLAARGEPPVGLELGPVVDAEDGVRVADVDGEQHAHARLSGRRGAAGRAPRRRARSRIAPSSSSSRSAPRSSTSRARPRSTRSPALTSTGWPHQRHGALAPGRHDRRFPLLERIIPDGQTRAGPRPRAPGVGALPSGRRIAAAERRRSAGSASGRGSRRCRPRPSPGRTRSRTPRPGCPRASPVEQHVVRPLEPALTPNVSSASATATPAASGRRDAGADGGRRRTER